MSRIDLDLIAEILRNDHGIANAYVEQTGGGVATIFGGPVRSDVWCEAFAFQRATGCEWSAKGIAHDAIPSQCPDCGGPVQVESRYAVAAGPGTFRHRDLGYSAGDTDDFYVGPDDEGDHAPLAVGDLGLATEEDVARLIAAQAHRSDPTLPLSADEVEALGFDSTGRS